MIHVTDAIAIDEHTISERFTRASGPGGQNVNKVATAVELSFDVAASTLPDDVKERLIRLAGTRVTTDGRLLIDSRAHRTQGQNREAARRRLVDLVRRAAIRPKKRRPTKPSASVHEERLASKKKRGVVKASRTTGRRPESDD